MFMKIGLSYDENFWDEKVFFIDIMRFYNNF